MAKKTVKVGLRSAGDEPAAGDVNISYKGARIAGLSESSTAVLETENTIVQDDIEVEYTKPTSEVVTIPVYTQVGKEGPLTFAKNITATAGEAITDTSIPIPAGVDTSMLPIVDFQPGLGSPFLGNVGYNTRDSVIAIEFYMPNRIPGNADKLVISMWL
jgi:hypothetical protein